MNLGLPWTNELSAVNRRRKQAESVDTVTRRCGYYIQKTKNKKNYTKTDAYLFFFYRRTFTEKNYSKLFVESLFKTFKNYSNYSRMLHWRTIGGTTEINSQKLLKGSNYSLILNYMCRRGCVYLK